MFLIRTRGLRKGTSGIGELATQDASVGSTALASVAYHAAAHPRDAFGPDSYASTNRSAELDAERAAGARYAESMHNGKGEAYKHWMASWLVVQHSGSGYGLPGQLARSLHRKPEQCLRAGYSSLAISMTHCWRPQ
jgi:hypothetical protein